MRSSILSHTVQWAALRLLLTRIFVLAWRLLFSNALFLSLEKDPLAELEAVVYNNVCLVGLKAPKVTKVVHIFKFEIFESETAAVLLRGG